MTGCGPLTIAVQVKLPLFTKQQILSIITPTVVGVYRDWPGSSALNLKFAIFTFTMEAILLLVVSKLRACQMLSVLQKL